MQFFITLESFCQHPCIANDTLVFSGRPIAKALFQTVIIESKG